MESEEERGLCSSRSVGFRRKTGRKLDERCHD